jgi:hypothetical protein
LTQATLKPPRLVWAVVGKKKGSTKSRVFLQTFGLYPSPEEALRAVQSRCSTSPDWRQRFAGWQFLAARSDFYIEIGDDAKMAVLHFNDREIAL